jgi:hypothetical protein
MDIGPWTVSTSTILPIRILAEGDKRMPSRKVAASAADDETDARIRQGYRGDRIAESGPRASSQTNLEHAIRWAKVILVGLPANE